MKVYVALCEGPHDIALIGKILKVYGFALVDGTVSTFPHPMNRMTKKSIAAAGQLQFSGMQNAVTILKSDYITREDILENEECDKIAGLFGIASKNFRSSP